MNLFVGVFTLIVDINIMDKLESIEELNNITKGDMPGDKIFIDFEHLNRAKVILPHLTDLLAPIIDSHPTRRAVISIYGGSGTGKSEIASLISYYFNQTGIGSYILSGDNYPFRIPKYNDAERLRIFRQSGIKGLITSALYTETNSEILKELQRNNNDLEPDIVKKHPWMLVYKNEGKRGLRNYLGTPNEINFYELNEIISQYKNGANRIYLKRMGRKEEDLWYEIVDFSNTKLLIIEWSHGNSYHLSGIDIPILLSSTPDETLKFRATRNRDKGADSHFTKMALDIEQQLIISQAPTAKLIASKDGQIISCNQYLKKMMKEPKE